MSQGKELFNMALGRKQICEENGLVLLITVTVVAQLAQLMFRCYD